ncbi:WD repeat-containing protein 64-like isoform X2 [Patiria miniata]|uniref:WD repeat-containing protein 64-like n=1 Tax=Patiria miniata TaxID=46514 RepID=A0A914BJ41_PATMI|nr:WD repeat-containing protein 64-like isoform X1 [Patiria miniata]XP_038075925.1 WD repeat-containing protein 64-like isoform X2 [Patiria miniata]
MASVEKDFGGLGRPYTSQTFTLKLKKFESYIAELTQQDSEASAEERRQILNENLRFDVFCEAIRSLFGPDIRSQDLKAIFRKISTNPDAKVDWSELFGYFQSEDEEPDQILNEDISVFTVSKKHRIGEAAGDKKRRDVISAVNYNPNVDIYTSASQKGAISVWNSKNLRLQACCDLNETSWVTGIDYLPSLRRVTAATERSICIWDHRAKGKNQSIFCIKPTDNSVQCMTYVPYNTTIHEDCLLFGDDLGYVSLLRIAAKDLNTKHAKIDKRNGNLVIEPSTLTYPIQKRKLHDDWVLKVKYLPDLRCFASCSPSSNTSFVLESVDRLTDTIPCKSLSIPKGVNCFAFCSHANVIATGGNDKMIRIWHPHIFSRPTGKMIGHLFTIIDIAVNEKDQHVISLSTARVFRVWDIHTLTSLQVFTDNEERPGEKRIHCMVYDERHERLITGSSVLDLWPLTRTVQDTMQVPHTHDRPVAQVLFNQELNQVVTVCTESIIKVWELESGKQVYHVTESHGPNVEVTAIAVDRTGYRLASGALDGSLKVWDFGSGQEIRSWMPSQEAERDEDIGVTSLLYIEVNEKRCIVASGWNNKLRLLEDSLDVGDLTPYAEFSDLFYLPLDTPSNHPLSMSSRSSSPFSRTRPLPSIGHASAQVTNITRKDNVLESHEVTCMTPLPPDCLATGCTNGNIIVWDNVTAAVQQVFRLYEMPPNSKNEHSEKTAHPRRVNTLLLMVHRTRKPDPAYIKKLTGHVSPSFPTPSDADEREMDADSTADTRSRTVTSSSRMGTGMAPMMDPVAEEMETGQDKQDPLEEDKIETDEQMEEEVGQDEGLDRQLTPEGDHNVDEELENIDPTAKMIVTTYDPILVSCHSDAFIRFWDMKGEMVREISAMTRRQGSPVTAVCCDEDGNVLITGDNKGYITMWSVDMFLENPQSEDNELIKQLISWRGHLSRIVTLVYANHMKSVISGSMDGSVRMWYGEDPARGHFMGFFSQHRPWNLPSLERSNTPVLPYDITEGPLKPMRSTNEKKHKTTQQSYQYPLVFADDKWKPFRRSAYAQTRTKPKEPEDMKFFEALQKPQFYNDHLKSCKTGEMSLGAVFRALPVYTVSTPDRMKTPAMEYGNASWTTDSFLFAPPPSKPVKATSPTKDTGKMKSQQKRSAAKDSTVALSSTSPMPSPRKR